MPANHLEPTSGHVTEPLSDLADLSWGPFFLQQLDADECQTSVIARVTAVHRSGLHVLGVGLDAAIPHFAADHGDEIDFATVGGLASASPRYPAPEAPLAPNQPDQASCPRNRAQDAVDRGQYRYALHRDLLQSGFQHRPARRLPDTWPRSPPPSSSSNRT